MGRHCAGRVVLFSMATAKGEDGFDRVDGHTSRGGAAFRLETSAEGELIVLRLGSRTMPVLYTHLIPATFGGRARMNVANALAAAAAAWAAGAHLHDIRQGLRTFSTSFFQAPGRLNLRRRRRRPGRHRLLPQRRRHAPAGRLRRPDDGRRADQGRAGSAPASAATRSGRAIGVLGIPGDRRDEDQREYGAIAAGAFDEIIVREDKNLRGRQPGETATNVIEGVRGAQGRRDGARRPRREGPRRDDRGPDRAPPGDPGRPRRVLRRRRDRGLPRGDGRRRARRAAGRRSPTRASWRRRRADRRRRAMTRTAAVGHADALARPAVRASGPSPVDDAAAARSPPGWRSTRFDGPRVARASCRSGWRTSRRGSCRPPPGPGAFPELNVRTYVRRRGRRGGLVPQPRRREPARGRRRPDRASTCRTSAPACRPRPRRGWVEYRSERTDPRGPAGRASTRRYRPDRTGRARRARLPRRRS